MGTWKSEIRIAEQSTEKIALDFGISVNTILKAMKSTMRIHMAQSETTDPPKSSNTTDADIN